MTLTIYNTKTGVKEKFKSLEPDCVKMYVCGPTVYNRVHIGNARPVVVFDTLFRLLKTLYSDVKYARNITDIDDKIMNTARENGESISSLAARFIDAYNDDMAALNNLPPTITPLATEHIEPMVAMVQSLVDKQHAYVSQGHVLFDVKSMDGYGRLSNRSLEDMLAGARVEVADYKKYAGDFVLWKPSSTDEPGWDSPWGRGRPGWHLECSAMIEKHLGDTIDIHAGGRDLIFPHHENEIAQSRCAHDGKEFVQYWMHNGYINIDGEKMSKSLGNFRMVNELLQQYPGEVLRFALLSAQYRSELTFSAQLLEQAGSALDTLYGFLRNASDVEVIEGVESTGSEIYKALLDDLNTPVAIRELHATAKAMNKAEGKEKARLKTVLLHGAALMGLLEQNPTQWFQKTVDDEGLSAPAIEEKIIERSEAKKNKDYALADQIREELSQQGVVLEDSGQETTWRRE
ncbi:MAG: cysteine--tRNA ligase [Spongiibacteraceae bacterium]|nr:cysteine--tRNA ligase [Spongiibacteraceae bacterium]